MANAEQKIVEGFATILDRATYGDLAGSGTETTTNTNGKARRMADEQEKKSDFKKIGVLWKRKDKNERPYYAGVLDVPLPSLVTPGMRLSVWPIKEKPKDKEGNEIANWPDAEVFVSVERQEHGSQAAAPAGDKDDLPF